MEAIGLAAAKTLGIMLAVILLPPLLDLCRALRRRIIRRRTWAMLRDMRS